MTQPVRTLHHRDAIPVVQLLRDTSASVQRVMDGALQVALSKVQDEVALAVRRAVLRLLAGAFLVSALVLVEVAVVLLIATRIEPWLAALLVAVPNILATVLFWTLTASRPRRLPADAHANPSAAAPA